MLERNLGSEVKNNTKELFMKKSGFSNRILYIDLNSQKIVQVKDPDLDIIRRIGDEVVSNGRIFKPKGIKGIIKGFQDDSCYIKVEWEDGDISFMKDKDLTPALKIEEQERELLKEQYYQTFDLARGIALKQGKKGIVEEMIRLKDIKGNTVKEIEELSQAAKMCRGFIKRYQESQENLNKSGKKKVRPRFFED